MLLPETYEQSNRLDSVPLQPTLSRNISPVPDPKWALENAKASVLWDVVLMLTKYRIARKFGGLNVWRIGEFLPQMSKF